jgi:hypothetical protein
MAGELVTEGLWRAQRIAPDALGHPLEEHSITDKQIHLRVIRKVIAMELALQHDANGKYNQRPVLHDDRDREMTVLWKIPFQSERSRPASRSLLWKEDRT